MIKETMILLAGGLFLAVGVGERPKVALAGATYKPAAMTLAVMAAVVMPGKEIRVTPVVGTWKPAAGTPAAAEQAHNFDSQNHGKHEILISKS